MHERDALPSLPRLLASALLHRGRRVEGSADLPNLALRIRRVVLERQAVERYRRHFGFDDGELPLTFAYLPAQRAQIQLMADRRFPLPLLGLIHRSNRFRLDGRIEPGDAGSMEVSTGGAGSMAKGLEFDVVSRFVAANGQVEIVSRYLHRLPSPPGAPAPQTEPVAPPGPPQGLLNFAADAGRRYAGLSGDWNPIHLPTFHRLLGFPRPIAHGMDTAARVLAAHGGAATALDVAFHKPIRLPATVEHTAARRDDGTVDIAVQSQGGEHLHLTGTLTPSDPS
ncbi:MAG: MaoC/PaaZ C-terminal domain-containing protein [Acidobacteriota bacterium]